MVTQTEGMVWTAVFGAAVANATNNGLPIDERTLIRAAEQATETVEGLRTLSRKIRDTHPAVQAEGWAIAVLQTTAG